MSAARWLREATSALATCARSALGWVAIAWWAALLPRRGDRLAVIGREDGKFVDNAKYFFLQASALCPGCRIAFVTERAEVRDLLAGSGFEVLRHPSVHAVWFLLRARTVVVDSVEWPLRFRRFLLAGAKKVQLWHGVGFKRIELDKWRNEVQAGVLSSRGILALRVAMHRFTGRFVRYDVVNATSSFYRDRVFGPALSSRRVVIAGYPRNTFARLPEPAASVAWRNVDAAIREQLPQWLASDRRIVLVAPTFRDTRAAPLGLTPDVVAMLDEFCAAERVELVFKFHPHERGATAIRGRHLHLCAADSDLYPLMPASSALVTDYSSIYMDYLLLDKPVLFLVPDLADYVRLDRQLQFDFEAMTPGPKVSTWPALIEQLRAEWTADRHATDRAKLVRLAFDGQAQERAVPTLLQLMRDERWLAAESPSAAGPR